jgi:hypothetical protein
MLDQRWNEDASGAPARTRRRNVCKNGASIELPPVPRRDRVQLQSAKVGPLAITRPRAAVALRCGRNQNLKRIAAAWGASLALTIEKPKPGFSPSVTKQGAHFAERDAALARTPNLHPTPATWTPSDMHTRSASGSWTRIPDAPVTMGGEEWKVQRLAVRLSVSPITSYLCSAKYGLPAAAATLRLCKKLPSAERSGGRQPCSSAFVQRWAQTETQPKLADWVPVQFPESAGSPHDCGGRKTCVQIMVPEKSRAE